MKLGNPKHAMFLGVVAVAAIAFFVIRLIPSGSGVAHPALRTASSGSGRGSTGGLPVEVLRDAFSHPALTKRYLASLPIDKQPPATWKPRPSAGLFGQLPLAIEQVVTADDPAGEAGSKPTKNTGTSRQLDGKPKSRIALRAIMRTATPLALVTIEGREDVTVGLGEYIDATYRISQFSQNAVLLVSDTEKTWLYVGHEVTEK